MKPIFTERKTCRLCHSSKLSLAIHMNSIPRGDGYLHPLHFKKEPELPLDILFCRECGNTQISIDMDPNLVYDDYIWTTHISPGLVASYQDYAADLAERYFPLDKWGLNKPFAVELGSNDGSFSYQLQRLNFETLGIDPAKEIAHGATHSGQTTWPEFFGVPVAEKILNTYKPADLIVANHMFANINDVQSIIDGVKVCLAPDGLFVIQVFYAYDVIKDNLIENFNHEHPSYYYTRTLKRFFEVNGFEIVEAKRVETKGGSLRLFVQRSGGPREISPTVGEFIKFEEALGLNRIETYKKIEVHIASTKEAFQKFFNDTRGQKLCAYGTSIGATVFAYQYGLGDRIDFFIDDDTSRWGLLSPGYGIPVRSGDALAEADYCILTAPLYAWKIREKNKDFKGKWVQFRPSFQVLEGNDRSW